jgi:hypothetical protein
LDPIGKVSQNASSLKPLRQFKPSYPGMIIGRSSKKYCFFMPIGNPRWLPLCGGSHLGFRISIKNPNFLEDLQMIIPGQLGFNCPRGLREEAF